MKEISRSAIVEHSAAAMYGLVDDIASYPSFLPWCVEARVDDPGPPKRATLTAGLSGIRYSFTTLNENRPARAIDMRLVEGPFRHFEASWRFTALAENACQIQFSMRFELARGPIGRLLAPLFNQIADTMVDAFTRRADELHAR
jgi:ribosome-associated toxin RatA of RatAB toxin-antitoxin module